MIVPLVLFYVAVCLGNPPTPPPTVNLITPSIPQKLAFDPTKCQDFDAIILLDTSSSIAASDLEIEKDFASELARQLLLLHNTTHIGLITFGPTIDQIPLRLTGMDNFTEIDEKIQSIFHANNGVTQQTPTDQALKNAEAQFTLRGRKNVVKIVFLITDGVPNDPDAASRAASSIKSSGVTVVTIGVGLEESQKQLNAQGFTNLRVTDILGNIASNPRFFYDVQNFGNLISELPNIVSETCTYVERLYPACAPRATNVTIIGYHLYNSSSLRVQFDFGNDMGNGAYLGTLDLPAHWVSNSEIVVTIPDSWSQGTNISKAVATVEVSLNGKTISTTNGIKFEFRLAGDHSPCSLGMLAGGAAPVAAASSDLWWLGVLIPLVLLCLLLPFLCMWCRRRRPEQKGAAAVPQHEQADAVPVAQAIMEDVVLVPKPEPVPPTGPKKWLIHSSSYIGFGKGKMDVNWNGEAPPTAPHALKRVELKDPTEPDAAQGPQADGAEVLVADSVVGYNEGFSTKPTTETPGCFDVVFGCCFKNKAKPASKPSAFKPASAASAPSAPASKVQPDVNQVDARAAIAAALRSAPPVRLSQPVSQPISAPTVVHQLVQPLPLPVAPPRSQRVLPPGWEMLYADDGRAYYENRDLQLTQWEEPV